MFDCIILCAGVGSRTNLNYNKILYEVLNKPLYKFSLDTLMSLEEVNKIILVVNEMDFDYFKREYQNDQKVLITIGGKERSDSVLNGLALATTDYVIIHDGARPNINKEEIINVYKEACLNQASCVAVKAKDTIKRVDNDNYILETLDRNSLWQMQTPQGINRKMMIEGLNKLNTNHQMIYDDVMVFEKVYGIKPKIVMGRYENIKVTSESDLSYIEYLLNKSNMEKQMFRIGHSNDVHELVKKRKLILGGIEIPYEFGLLGHSDADVLLHAVTESIIGALGLCDIGTLFPDNDDKYLNMDSSYFVSEAYKLMDSYGYKINNIDIIVYLEKPNLSKYKPLMRKRISELLHTDISNVNVKATRKEGLGYIGEGKAIEAESVVLLVRK